MFPILRIALMLLALVMTGQTFLAQQIMPPVPTAFTIAGTVVDTTNGAVLNEARVLIINTKDPNDQQSLITGSDGRFSFFKVPAGKYSLQASRRHFEAAGYDQHDQYATAIVTGAGLATENLTLRLQPSAVVGGRILDEAEEPIRRANVALFRVDHDSGIDRILRFRDESSDDQGNFEFADLSAGTYYVSATSTPWYAIHPSVAEQDPNSSVDPALDVAYATTYYQDSSEPDDAVPIPVKGGDHLDITLHLTPAPALRVRLHLDGKGFQTPNLQRPSLDGTEYVQTESVQANSRGIVEMSGIPAGKYQVRVPSQEPGNFSEREMEMTLTSDGEEFDAGKADQNAALKIQVAMIDGGSPPASVDLLDTKGKFVSAYHSGVDSSGKMELQNIPPGQYRFRPDGSSRYTVLAVTDQGQPTSGNLINVTSGSTHEVTLKIAEGNANVEGFVQKAGKASAGAMVVLVPRDPESNRELFRRDQSDLDGSFELRNIAPGKYTIVAIENGWDLDWSEPAVIAYYVKRGQLVTVHNGENGMQRLPSSVEVQSK